MTLTSRITTAFILFFSLSVSAKGTYQTPDQFIYQAFEASVPKPQFFWIEDEAQQVLEEILAHKFNKIRIRYWQQGKDTAWVLSEIGKESLITVGIHIKDHAIQQTKVLIYRESRGDEVRHDFFTNQFESATLNDDRQLDRLIDGITGATLSVRALTKLSRVALWLDRRVMKD